jgi:hypothetical protein
VVQTLLLRELHLSGMLVPFSLSARPPRAPSLKLGAPSQIATEAGYKNTKYLTKVVFPSHRNGGYWSDKGYEWYGGT